MERVDEETDEIIVEKLSLIRLLRLVLIKLPEARQLMIILLENESKYLLEAVDRVGEETDEIIVEKLSLIRLLRLVLIKLPVRQLMIILPKNLLSIHLSNWLYWKPRSELTKFLSIHPLRLY